MKKTLYSKLLTFIFCTVLIAAIALLAAGCGKTPETGNTATTDQTKVEATTIGEGATEFYFNVLGPEGETFSYDVFTDESTVGAALSDLGLIEGEDSAYGMYVKTVNGITLDYNADGMYWSFYVGDTYASESVDTTEIVQGETYAFKAEKS